MRLRISLFSAFMALLITQNLYAQQQILSLKECLKIGLEKNKSLKISQSKIEFARAKLDEADAALLPSLRFTGGYTRLSEVEPFKVSIAGKDMQISPSVFDNYQLRLSAQQPLFTGFRLEGNSEMLKYQEKAAREDLSRDLGQLIFDIKNSFWSFQKAKDFLKSVNESINQVNAHLADIESMYRNGMATNNDVLKVKVQLTNTKLIKIDAENALEMSRLGLCNTLGIPVLSSIDIEDAQHSEPKENAPEFDNLIKLAYSGRSELKAMAYRVEAGKSLVEVSKSGWYPQVNLAANYYYNRPNNRIMPTRDEFIGTWDIGISLSYDIWNWMIASHQEQQAEENLFQTQLSMEQIKDAISLELSQSFMNYEKSLEKISASEEALAQAEENYRVSNEKFRSGAAISSELLDAEVFLLNAKINRATALADYEIALAKLDKALGKTTE